MAFRSANSGSTHHDRDRLIRGAATRLSFAAGRSTAPLPLAQRSSGQLSRAGRREQYHPMTGKEHPIATLYPSKSSLMVIATTRQQTLATLKSPWRVRRIGALPTRGFLPCRFSNAGPVSARRQASAKGRHPKTFTEADIACGGPFGEESDAHRKACCQGVGSTLINLYPLKGSARRRLGSRRTSPCHFTEPATAPASRWCAPGGPDIRSSAVARSTCRGRRRCRLLPCRSAWPRAARRPSRRPLA